ncbi:hypothetical protein KCP73_02560 [Salmonella enterica subsp. enterica]|nr:hypothetical protein KCP73_02560 [Salmonella enterica subsp. enterica]
MLFNNYAKLWVSGCLPGVYFCAYFGPYALIVVRQLGSTQRGKGRQYRMLRCKPGLALPCGMTYWVVHIPYRAKAAGDVLIALRWAFVLLTALLMREYTVVKICSRRWHCLFLYAAKPVMKSLKAAGSRPGLPCLSASILYTDGSDRASNYKR